jgi:membrane protease YdiL (CAAX protease family)
MIQKHREKQMNTIRHQVFFVTFAAFVILYGSFLIGQVLIVKPLSVLDDSAWKQLVAAYLPFLPVLLSLCIFTHIAEPELFAGFASSKKNGMQGNNAKTALVGLLTGFAAILCCAGPAVLHGDFSLCCHRASPLFLIIAVAFVLLQSAAEELLFRGFVMGALQERYGLAFAVLVNPLLFMLAHSSNSGVSPVSLLTSYTVGFCLSILLNSLNSIWFAIAVHTGWNYTQNILLGLPNSGLVPSQSLFRLNSGAVSSLWYDTVFGMEGSIAPILFWPVLTAVIILLLCRSRK